VRRLSTFLVVAALVLAVTPLVLASGSQDATAAAKGPVTIKVLFSHAGSVYGAKETDWANNIYAKAINKITGYNIVWEFGPHVEYAQFISVRFASGDLPDVIRSSWGVDATQGHPGAVDQGVFTEMGPLVDKYGPDIKKNIPEDLWKSPLIAKNGKIWGIPVLAPYAATRVVYVRRDWLDKAGMKTPVTVEDYLKYFEWVKTADANGNGDPNDEYGYFVRENMAYSELFFKAYGVYPNSWQYANGQFVPEMILPQMKEAIKFWKMLYDKGYVNPNMFTNKSADWVAGIYNDKAGMWQHDVGNYEISWVTQMLNKDAKIDMIAAPVGPVDKTLVPQGNRFYFAMVFPAKSKVQADAVKWVNTCWSNPEAETFFLWGIKDYNYTVDSAGKIQWDAKNPNNATDGQNTTYRILLNPTVYHYDTPKLLAARPNAKVYLDGIETAKNHSFKNVAIDMPTIEVLKTAPELTPGFVVGGLFLDMFAKVVTGKEDLEPAFNAFVAEWKKRGGDAAIKQATEWYDKTQKK
jgi:putative aldouronate transport system substrate-binding protein